MRFGWVHPLTLHPRPREDQAPNEENNDSAKLFDDHKALEKACRTEVPE